MNLKFLIPIIALSLTGLPQRSFAEPYYWCFNNPETTTGNCRDTSPTPSYLKYPSLEALRSYFEDYYTKTYGSYISKAAIWGTSGKTSHVHMLTVHRVYGTSIMDSSWTIHRGGNGCNTGLKYNAATGSCDSQSISQPKRELPSPAVNPSCSGKFAGNPLLISNGAKYQEFEDYKSPSGIGFKRIYSTTTKSWSHNFSDRLVISDISLVVERENGQQISFTVSGTTLAPDSNSQGSLTRDGQAYVFSAPDGWKIIFDSSGNLTQKITPSGQSYIVQKSQSGISIGGALGESYTITEDQFGQPTSFATATYNLKYNYDALRRLVSVTKNNAAIPSQTLAYADTRFPSYLTSIKDENGVVFASWTYDDKGRGLTSEHAGGAEHVAIAYNTDGSRTVTNGYGKKATYRFQVINGNSYITSIEGEPTPNCPASNSSFTYDAQGLMKTKTDAKGNITTYDYNDRGLETSRTEASGTPQARTVTTEWHPSLYLKTKVTEPDRITTYQYDTQGRQTGQTATPR
ncbi:MULTISPECIES: RHS repeat domain-containing protein [Pseudomonas]|uniref:RHS repeat domain-containing protein n=1 Tax=Pseudomonas nitroreducens TaxID=46680 RepID=UPI001E3B4096|nr:MULTISPECIES: RHS repeat protein [Pseudomonas]MCE4070932.1 RHS repeat protein [Pseudomonas nitritireducens]MCE4081185.1 RHS repeat protein [Pseudomonas nitroreducens]